jgi:hypothetical protein
MKKVYHVGDDLFIALAFVTFILGGLFKLLGINKLIYGITPLNLIFLAVVCLLFSIALSLYDVAHGEK